MNAAAEIGRNPVRKPQIQPEYGDEQRDGTAEPISRDQILRRERGQGNTTFSCPADHEQDWEPYPVDPSLATYDDHTYAWLGSCLIPSVVAVPVCLCVDTTTNSSTAFY